MVRLKRKDIRKRKHNDKRELQREIEKELGRLYPGGGSESHDNRFRTEAWG